MYVPVMADARRLTQRCSSAVFQNGYTPLMYAAKDNRVIVVDKLIELGCNVNHKSEVSPKL